MPRARNAIPAAKLTIHLPREVKDQLDLFLFSEAQGRIPYSAHQDFIVARIREFFEKLRVLS